MLVYRKGDFLHRINGLKLKSKRLFLGFHFSAWWNMHAHVRTCNLGRLSLVNRHPMTVPVENIQSGLARLEKTKYINAVVSGVPAHLFFSCERWQNNHGFNQQVYAKEQQHLQLLNQGRPGGLCGNSDGRDWQYWWYPHQYHWRRSWWMVSSHSIHPLYHRIHDWLRQYLEVSLSRYGQWWW